MTNPGKSRYETWGLTHDPFTPLATGLTDKIRRAVFTGYEDYLSDLIHAVSSAHACCVFGTCGMGKTFLLLEAAATLRDLTPGVLPAYGRVLPKLGFDLAVLDALAGSLTSHPATSGGRVEVAWGDIEAARQGKRDAMDITRTLAQGARNVGLTPVLLIDDTDRVEEVSKIKAMVDSTRELLDLQCGVAVPSNPHNVTKILRTAGHGIFDSIDLQPFETSDFKLMVSRYLSTARTAGTPTSSDLPLVFLCHATEDKERVRTLRQTLARLGYWGWMAPDDILPGREWPGSIEEAIKDAEFFIACLSPQSVDKRGVVQRELKAGLARVRDLLPRDIFIIPVRLEDCKIPKDLEKIQAADLWEADGVSRLQAALDQGASERGIQPGVPAEAFSLAPFNDEGLSYLIDRIGLDAITPRIVLTSCRILLKLGKQHNQPAISRSFIEEQWDHIGGNLLANEGRIDRLASVLSELAVKNGYVDEEVDLITLKKMLDSNGGEFVDVIKRIEEQESAQDLFVVREKDGLMSIELSPLLSPEFIRESFMKLKLPDFRRKFGDDEPVLISYHHPEPPDEVA